MRSTLRLIVALCATGKGDICRFISSKGWVPGNWRLPTRKDWDDLFAKPQVAWSGSTWRDIKVAPAGSNTYGDHAHGFYQPAAGRFFGKGAAAGDNKQCPAEGIVTFSAGGGRNTSGSAYVAGAGAFLWTASTYNSSEAYRVQVYSSGALRDYGTRRYGYLVRCVKEQRE